MGQETVRVRVLNYGIHFRMTLAPRKVYPFKPARSIIIIVFYTDYASDNKTVCNYALAKRRKRNIMAGRRDSRSIFDRELSFLGTCLRLSSREA